MRFASIFAGFFIIGCSTSRVVAQCIPDWQAGFGYAGVDLTPTCATLWDHDGNTSTPRWLVVGGSFWHVGTVQAGGVAAWDPTTGEWHTLGTGPLEAGGGFPNVLAALPDGTLVAGGWFTSGVAAWDGTEWTALGGGVTGEQPVVFDMTVTATGDLIVAGGFTEAGGVPTTNLAKWNGTAWSEVAPGIGTGIDWSQGWAEEVAVLPNGDLVVAGGQQLMPDVFQFITRWDGTAWQEMGIAPNGPILDLDVSPAGELYVAGGFSQLGGVPANRVAKWTGTTWTALGTGINDGRPAGDGYVYAIDVSATGDVYAGGSIYSAGVSAAPSILVKWDGTAWTATNTGWEGTEIEVRFVELLEDGSVVIKTDTPFIGGEPTGDLARWNGAQWSGLNRGFDDWITDFDTMPDGRIVAGGLFSSTPDCVAPYLAIWDGSQWSPVEPELPFGALCEDVVALSDGNFAFGFLGAFVSNGTGWIDLGVEGYAHAMAQAANGDLLIGGEFITAGGVAANSIARWDGESMAAIGGGIGLHDGNHLVAVTTILELPNGNILAGGEFSHVENGTIAANNLAIWNGTSWSEFAGGTAGGLSGAVYDVIRLSNGDILIGGFFTSAGGVPASGIARWDGVAWSALGSVAMDFVLDLHVAPNGDIYAAGDFEFLDATGLPARGIARWDGTAWHAMGDGLEGRPGTGSDVRGQGYCVTEGPGGDLLVGGIFFKAGGLVSANFARYGCVRCDDIDFNNNDVFPEDQDVIDFFNVLAGAECSACNDIDFNNNGVFPEDQDVIDFFNVLAGGECT